MDLSHDDGNCRTSLWLPRQSPWFPGDFLKTHRLFISFDANLAGARWVLPAPVAIDFVSPVASFIISSPVASIVISPVARVFPRLSKAWANWGWGLRKMAKEFGLSNHHWEWGIDHQQLCGSPVGGLNLHESCATEMTLSRFPSTFVSGPAFWTALRTFETSNQRFGMMIFVNRTFFLQELGLQCLSSPILSGSCPIGFSSSLPPAPSQWGAFFPPQRDSGHRAVKAMRTGDRWLTHSPGNCFFFSPVFAPVFAGISRFSMNEIYAAIFLLV